ncbi:hypothetical protein ACIOHC_36410 [Streptomyces sp. NPDC088252]|uniref:hypothetical protein n=1 Tax=Streptomyces sp. NPDC088252 TaxID=3365845 RepID=UPI00382474DC
MTKEFLTRAYQAGGVCAAIGGVTAVLLAHEEEYVGAGVVGACAILAVVPSQVLYWYAEDILPRWFSRVPKEEDAEANPAEKGDS